MPRSENRLRLLVACSLAAWFAACSAAPGPGPGPRPSQEVEKPRPPPPDDCAEIAGQPPPEPLKRAYTGVAARARCQREVYTIMGGITHFLGVRCDFCHVEPNYEVMTHNKRVANWMATQLVPRLAKDGGGRVWCNDCHLVSGKGRAEILGNPRSETWAIEWMTTHLVEDLRSHDGKPLRCKGCHGGNLGSPEFRKKIILTGDLPGGRPDAVGAEPASDADAGTTELDAGAAGEPDRGAAGESDAGAAAPAAP